MNDEDKKDVKFVYLFHGSKLVLTMSKEAKKAFLTW
jgi:hypothetical protein